jgi:tetratricopeptide (TPR) repeat protein
MLEHRAPRARYISDLKRVPRRRVPGASLASFLATREGMLLVSSAEHQPSPPPSETEGTTARAHVDWKRLEVPLAALLSSLGVLAVVSWTIAPSITFGDSPELVAAAADLGLAHPPGYPLWTIANHLAIRISGAANPALAVNMMSAICLGLTGLFAFIAYRQLGGSTWAAVAVAWAVCLTPVIWDQGTMAEVYAMDLALLSACVAATLVLHTRVRDGQSLSPWSALGLGALIMAAITHRGSNALLLAGCLIPFLALPRPRWLRLGTVGAFLAGIALVSSLWLYIPLRGGMWPAAPGAPDEIAKIHLHGFGGEELYACQRIEDVGHWGEYIRAKVFADQLWSPLPRIWGTVASSDLLLMSRELNAAVWILAAVGGVLGWRRLGARIAPFAWIAVVDLLVFWNYWVYDRDVFFIPLYYAVGGLAVVGVAVLARYAAEQRDERAGRLTALCFAGLVAAGVIVETPRTFRELDRTHYPFADLVAQGIMASMPDERGWVMVGRPRVGSDHIYHPILYYGTVIGAYMPGHARLFGDPPQGAAALRRERIEADLLDAMEVTDAVREAWYADDSEAFRGHIMAEQAMREENIRGLVGYRFARDEWYVIGGGWPRTHLWTNEILREPLDQRAEEPEAYEHYRAQALEWARACLSVRPGDPILEEMAFAPLLELVDERVVYGDFGEAFALLQAAEEMAPGSAYLGLQISYAFSAAGLDEEAIATLRTARPRSLPNTQLWHHITLQLGWTLGRTGRYEEAIPVLEDAAALRHDPMPHVRDALERCYSAVEGGPATPPDQGASSPPAHDHGAHDHGAHDHGAHDHDAQAPRAGEAEESPES